jgi:hypothetical protein
LGGGKLGKNAINSGQTSSTGMPPKQKVNKAEELTYLFINILQALMGKQQLL